MSAKLHLVSFVLVACAMPLLSAAGKPDQKGAETAKKPVSASIVEAKAKSLTPPAGNVRVKYADGTTDAWTTKGIAMEPKVAADGTVGWYLCAADAAGKLELEGGDTPIPVALVVCRGGKILATIKDLANPRDWGFDPDGTHVMVHEGAKHGPGWVRRFDIKSGKETNQFSFAGVDDASKCPAWAKAFFEQ